MSELLLEISLKRFKELYEEFHNEEEDMGNNIFNVFSRCIWECFWQCCMYWEDIQPYKLSEQEIEKIFFEALFDFWRKEFYEYWLIEKGEPKPSK